METPKTNEKEQAKELLAQLKKEYPGHVLFFRMEESYETYFEDAKICSRICGLKLGNRNKDNRLIPLVYILVHAIEGYLIMMLQAGYKVAVFEWFESSERNVRRDCVRLLTPGTS